MSSSSDLPGTPVEAHQRFLTLELAATASHDSAALARIMARAAEARRRETGPDSVRLFGPPGGASAGGSDDTWERQSWRIWWAPPTHWREDLIWPGGQTVVIVVRPDVSLSYVSMHRTLYTSEPPPPATAQRLADQLRSLFRETREGAWPPDAVHLSTIAERLAEFPLTNPRLPAFAWELTTLGEEEYLGRVARRVRATRRAGASRDDEPWASGYWPWLDEYECLVDDTLPILLRLTGMADGVPVGIISAADVRVNAPIPDDAFAFAPPAGTRTVHSEGRI